MRDFVEAITPREKTESFGSETDGEMTAPGLLLLLSCIISVPWPSGETSRQAFVPALVSSCEKRHYPQRLALYCRYVWFTHTAV